MDIIFRRVRGVNTFMGGVILVATFDSRQLQPILLSLHILTCFQVRPLEYSVGTAKCLIMRWIIAITRYTYTALIKYSRILVEFCNLLENCTFIYSWDDPI